MRTTIQNMITVSLIIVITLMIPTMTIMMMMVIIHIDDNNVIIPRFFGSSFQLGVVPFFRY